LQIGGEAVNIGLVRKIWPLALAAAFLAASCATAGPRGGAPRKAPASAPASAPACGGSTSKPADDHGAESFIGLDVCPAPSSQPAR